MSAIPARAAFDIPRWRALQLLRGLKKRFSIHNG